MEHSGLAPYGGMVLWDRCGGVIETVAWVRGVLLGCGNKSEICAKNWNSNTMKCCVPGCQVPGGHLFPQDKKLRQTWIHAVKRLNPRTKRNWKPSRHHVVCKQYFKEEDYVKIGYHGELVLWLGSRGQSPHTPEILFLIFCFIYFGETESFKEA